jgi:predicted TIM-barrel fold metal-dependent hydrolase
MVLENHLVKFDNLRIASVENGAEFLPDFFRKIASVAHKVPGYFPDDPADIFREHVWINPFWEDDVHEVIHHMGADRVLFGSDWPHIEALPAPLDYLRELKDIDADDRRRIVHDNVVELTARRPT